MKGSAVRAVAFVRLVATRARADLLLRRRDKSDTCEFDTHNSHTSRYDCTARIAWSDSRRHTPYRVYVSRLLSNLRFVSYSFDRYSATDRRSESPNSRRRTSRLSW